MSSQPAPFGSPIIIAGMHRSGTSLAASLLQSAGLDVGERLMEGNWSNPRGHFEDLDFVKDRLLHVSAQVVGPGEVRDILFRNAFEKPIQ